MRVLFITPHLGGGVGKAIIGLCTGLQAKAEEFQTDILLLEKPEKPEIVDSAKGKGINVILKESFAECSDLIEQADVVIFNWWDHPLAARFLYEFPDIPCRLVIWSHINGCHYPYLNYSFLDRFDYTFFTSSYSYQNSCFSFEQKRKLQDKSTIVYGSGDYNPDKITRNRQKKREGFRIGYAGTLSYSKISEDFVNYLDAFLAKNEESEVYLAGDPDQDLEADILKSTFADRYHVTGYLKDMEEFWEKIDIFSYLLTDSHFGTTENVILEAMAHEIPVVCMDGGVERAIIRNGENGVLVRDKEEFLLEMDRLTHDDAHRARIGRIAKKSVYRFSQVQNVITFMRHIKKVMKKDKCLHGFSDVIGDCPYQWFLTFTGEDKSVFESRNKESMLALCKKKRIYLSRTKSSPFQFTKYFSEDGKLNGLCTILENQC